MNIVLVVAILFTIAAVASLFTRKNQYWWLFSLLFFAGAIFNWLRYFGIVGG